MKKLMMRMISILVLLSVVLPFCVFPATAAGEQTATLVTNASSLKAGDKIILVASDYDYAMSTTQNSNNRGQAAVTKSGSTVTFDATVQVLELVAGTVSGSFGLSTGDGYLCAASSSSNYLRTKDELDENSSWKISVSDGAATVVAQGTYTRNRIFYNSSSKIFSSYASDSTTQKAISIYLVGGTQGGDGGDGGDPDQPGGGDLEDGDTNVLIKNAANLKVGDKIIIAALDYDFAISTTQNTNNRARADITKSDDTIRFGSDVQIIELVAGAVSGTFGFCVGTEYLYAASSSSNYLKTKETLDENASWKITVDSATGSAVIAAQGEMTRNLLRYNASGAGLFSCYGANNTQKDVCIYLIRNENGGGNDNPGTGGDTSGTGYDSADDVDYNTVNGVITNWGARDELALFLSAYAAAYYSGSYAYDMMSQLSGGTSASNAPGSDLYEALQAMMVAEHTSFTKYGSSSSMDCKNFYLYTDCLKNDYSMVSTIYRGYLVNSTWDGGSTYNQEHIWPKSKCIGTDSTDIGDIMHLRAANPNENSTRGNSAYGESSGYYTPNANVRGDCARTVLYMYVRWGNTANMWGTNGVMESLEILLKWMEEDPVDTWEMGRNDAVQSITGVRNVFVDYPEYAWLLFGEEIPSGMTTPSGSEGDVNPDPEHSWIAATCTAPKTCILCGITEGSALGHSYSPVITAPGCTVAGFTTYTCVRCGDSYTGNPTAATGHQYSATVTPPTCTTGGYTTFNCTFCGHSYTGNPTGATGGHNYTAVVTPPTCTTGGYTTYTCTGCGHSYTGNPTGATGGHNYAEVVTPPACATAGYTTYTCTACGHSYTGNPTAATGHRYTSVVTAPSCATEGYTTYTCSVCGHSYTGDFVPGPGHDYQTRVVAPTCTATGYTTYTCLVCGESDIGDTVPARGHSYKATVTPATCTTSGYTTCVCFLCGDTYTGDITEALGHSYTENVIAPTCTVAGYTSFTCGRCGDSYTGDITAALGHKYENGVCVQCGHEDSGSVVFPTLKIHHASVSFEDEIWYNLYFVASDLKDVADMGLLVFDSLVEDGGISQASQVIKNYSYDGTYYMAHTDGVPAKKMGDTLYFRLYAEMMDGTYIFSDMVCYDVILYANSILRKSTNVYMKALVVATLNYGAEAQMYFGYRTESLMNSGLTQEHQALARAYSGDTMPDPGAVDSKKNGIFTNTGFGKSSITASFEAAFAMNYYVNPTYTPDGTVTLYYWTEEAYAAAATLIPESASGCVEMTATGAGNQYFAAICGIAAQEMGKTIYAGAVYQSGGVTYSTVVMNYSMGKYCDTIAGRETSNQRALSMAAAVYGASARDYFASL